MVGSSQSTAGPMFVLNTIVADSLEEIADTLEKSDNVKTAVQKLLQKIAKEHSRIIYNGDNYDPEWVDEAKKRGLPNMRSSVDALNTLMDKENVELFKRHKVLSKAELHARTEILFEAYSKMINIEALTMLNMAKRQILPAAVSYSGKLGRAAKNVKAAGVSSETQVLMLEKVCGLISSLDSAIESLEDAVTKAGAIKDAPKRAERCHDSIRPAMQAVRQASDELENIVDAELWPLPTYAEMLFLR